jgi:hypothetical protein
MHGARGGRWHERRLSTARRPDLAESVEKRRKQAEGNLRCAAFEEDIRQRLPNDKVVVSRQFKDAEIIAIAEAHNVI